MNIFFLDPCPYVAATKQVSKSATKMILETAQMLSDAVRTYGYDGGDVYKGAYHNHPSTVWARRNRTNFQWLCEHGLALADRYTKQYGKIHKSQAIIERCIELIDLIPDDNTTDIQLTADDLAIKSTEAGLAALDRYLDSTQQLVDAIDAYTAFYFAKPYVQKALAN